MTSTITGDPVAVTIVSDPTDYTITGDPVESYFHLTAIGSPVLPAFTADGAAMRTAVAAGAPAMPALTAAGVAERTVKAVGAPTLAAFSAFGLANIPPHKVAGGSPILAAFTAAGVAERTVGASGSPSLGAFTATGGSIIGRSASGSPTLAAFTANGVAVSSADISATFGALTAAGAGGIAVTGTSISTGDASGHWQITGGYLVPSAAGDSADLSSGNTLLTLDNGETVDITVDANRYDVRTIAEFDTAVALGSAARSGKTINFRAGDFTGQGKLNLAGLANTDYCTIQSDAEDRTYTWGYGTQETITGRSGAAKFDGALFGNSGAAYWKLRNLRFYEAATADGTTNSFPPLIEVRGADRLDIQYCELHSDQMTYTQTGGSSGKGNEGKRQPYGIGSDTTTATGGVTNFTFDNNFCHDLGQICNLCCKSTISFQTNIARDVWKNWIELMDQYPGTVAAREVTAITIRDNVFIGNTFSYEDISIHSAVLAFQAEYKDGINIDANIILPVYDWNACGPPDVDGENGDTYAKNVLIRGNTMVTLQAWCRIKGAGGTCKQIGNTLFLRYPWSKTYFSSAPGNDSSGPETVWHTPAYTSGHINRHNLTMGTSSGTRWGAGAGGSNAGNVTDDAYNLGWGNGLYVRTDASGVITNWGQPDTDITINGGLRDIRYDTILPNAVNASGDFCRVDHIDIMTIRSDIADHLSGGPGNPDYWVGAVGSGYVTYQAGHMTSPQTSTINAAME